MRKRVVSLFLTLCLIAGFMPCYVQAAGTADDIVAIAAGEVGTKETGNNCVKYNTWYYGNEVSGDAYPWCAAFVAWCANEAGILNSKIPKTARSTVMMQSMLQNYGAVEVSDRQAGDIVFYYCNSCKLCRHVGIVADATYSYEGNYSNKVSKVNVSSKYTCSTCKSVCTRRYVRPAYENTDEPINVSVSTDSTLYSQGDTVRFNISANKAVSYSIDIFCNDVKIWTGNIDSNFSYTPTRIGKYMACVTAYNSAGASSSSWVEFDMMVGSRSVSGDFNGDGIDDYATLYGVKSFNSQWHVFLSTGTEFSEEIWWDGGGYGSHSVSGRVTAGDYNGDGLDDVAVMYDYGDFDSKIHVFLSTGSSFKSWNTWYSDPTSYQSRRVTGKLTSGDFNGDGLDDIAAMYEYDAFSTTIHVFTSTGSSFNIWQSWYEDPTGYNSNRVAEKFTSGDFNGDGLDDIAAMYEYDTFSTAIHVFISTGSSFNIWQSWYEDPTGYESNKVAGRFTAGDFNGDGLDDIAAMYEYDEFMPAIHVFISTGNKFNSWRSWINDSAFAPKSVTGRFVAGDFNGDGADDIATMYDYDESYAIFHMYISDKTKFDHQWWNRIDNYNVKRTTGVKSVSDNNSQTMSFSHKHTYIKKITAPTCTEQGYTFYICTQGDFSYKDNYVAPNGHEWNDWFIEELPTYEKTGVEKRICSNCKEIETRIIEKLTTPPTLPPTATPENSPVPTYAGTITAQYVSAGAGDTVTMPVTISENPGIAGYNISISYDKTAMTPTAVNKGADFSAGTLTSNLNQGTDAAALDSVTAYWSNPSDIKSNGELFNITFKIKDTAEAGTYPITLKYSRGDITNQKLEDITPEIVNGSVTVSDIQKGDIYEDGAVNTKDGVLLSQYLAKWDVRFSDRQMKAADVYEDGAVNTKDGVKLSQVLAKWNGVTLAEEVSAMSAGSLILNVESRGAVPGGYVDIPVIAAENPGISGFNFNIEYDKSLLTPVSVTPERILAQGSFTSNLDQGGDISALDFVTAYWSNPSDMTETGELFTVRFKVNEDISGDIPVELTYTEGDICNQQFEDISADITNGVITVVPQNGEFPYEITAVRLSSADGAVSETIPQGESFTVAAEVSAVAEYSGSAKLLVGLYGGDGQLLEAKQCAIADSAEYTVDIPGDYADIKEIKVFIWDEQMTPLAQYAAVE